MIRMITSIAGTPSFEVGEVVVLDSAIERAWISAGYAEAYDGERPIETASVAAPERAIKRRPRARQAVS